MRPLAKKHRLEEPAAPLNRVLGLARRAWVVGVSFCDHQIATLDLVLAVHDLPDRSGDIPVAMAEGGCPDRTLLPAPGRPRLLLARGGRHP